jgi:hypothetical protein
MKSRLVKAVCPMVVALCLFSRLPGVAAAASRPQAACPIGTVLINYVEATPGAVSAWVSVTGPDGSALRDLPADAFEVAEDERAAPGASVAQERAGMALVVVVDHGTSMGPSGAPGALTGTRLDDVREIVTPFLWDDALWQGNDWFGAVGFSDAVEPVWDLIHDHVAIGNHVYEMEVGPPIRRAVLLDAVRQAIALLSANPSADVRRAVAPLRKVILIVSDGVFMKEETGAVTDAVRRAVENKITLNSLAIGSRSSSRLPMRANDLEGLAKQTGGQFIALTRPEDRDAVNQFLTRLASQSTQYVIRYPSRADPGQHLLRVTVRAGGCSREGTISFVSTTRTPQVAITAPLDGTSVRRRPGERLHIESAVTFPDGYSRPVTVTYLLDQQIIGQADVAPFALEWDPGATPGGTRRLTAEITDSLTGKTGESVPVTFDLSPLQAPQVALKYVGPTAIERRPGATARLEAVISFPDEYPRPLARVVFYDGDREIGVVTSDPFVLDWDLSTVSEGEHLVMAEAWDSFATGFPAARSPRQSIRILLPPLESFLALLARPATWVILVEALGVLVLFVLLFRVRRQVASGVSRATRTVVRTITRPLQPVSPAVPYLEIKSGPGVGTRYPLSRVETCFGRDKDRCDEVINDLHVSGKHFSVRNVGGGFVLIDENSRNGTILNGSPIPPQIPVALPPGSRIRVGMTDLELVQPRAAPPTQVVTP